MIKHAAILAAMLCLAGCASTGAPAEKDYVAHFNEPFLTFASSGSELTLTSPEDMDGSLVNSDRKTLPNGATFTGMLDEDRDESRFRLTIREGECTDDMAGLPYSHTAVLERGESLELPLTTGCARLSSEPQPCE